LNSEVINRTGANLTNLASKLKSGKFIVTSELTPPKGTDLSQLFKNAEMLKDSVDAFNLTDSHASRMSLAPIGAAHLLLDRHIEPILQMTTRDRNRIALQGDMLAASALGIENLVCMGGDPPHLGDHPSAKAVFDLSTMELIAAAGQLNKGEDLTGNKLNKSPAFHIGAVVNPGADDLDVEIQRMQQKAEAGAVFFQTQAIYDVRQFTTFMEKIAHLDVHVLAGILPVKSESMANYMNENVPGIDIPADLIEQIRGADDVKATSANLAAEVIRGIRSRCSGIHLMALGWEDQIPTILELAELS
jgi:methylenetetrahydrofolate reductase (NADPH)